MNDTLKKATFLTKRRLKRWTKVTVVVVVFHIAGFFSSIDAIMGARTPQGATAWAIALNTIPYIAVPSYWLFGENDFNEYAEKCRSSRNLLHDLNHRLNTSIQEANHTGEIEHTSKNLIEALTPTLTTQNNSVELLVDGEAAFNSIYEGIAEAQDYVLVQFFTIANDAVGKRLAELLVEKEAEGVDCYVIYDGIGSNIETDYTDPLTQGGVDFFAFNDEIHLTKLFRLNFRNHRKLIVTDGRAAWIGGMNAKEDYLTWRDTMVKIDGPAVQTLQGSFVEDWAWCSSKLLSDLNWEPASSSSGGSAHIASVSSGPAGEVERFTLLTLDAINQAEERLWIASPYFVPDDQILSALQAAALRGVDLRIITPSQTDTMLAKLAQYAAWSYIRDLEFVGAKFYQYTSPFMHQKIFLADDDFAMIGSANFDNRSFRLNFELTAVISDQDFNSSVAAMLEADMSASSPITKKMIDEQPFWERLRVRAARLTAPLL